MLGRTGRSEDAERSGRLAADAAALARSLGMSWLARRADEVASVASGDGAASNDGAAG